MSINAVHGIVPAWTMGDRIRKARREAGISQAELLGALALAGVDVTKQALGNWESGANDVSRKLRDTVATVVALRTGVNRAWLLGEAPSDGGPGRSRTDDLRGVSAAL